MSSASACVAGVFFGLLGSLPPAYLFERALKTGTRASVGSGLASILASFVLQSLALVAVGLLARERLLEFGCTMVGAFLCVWGVESVRAWRAANASATSNANGASGGGEDRPGHKKGERRG